MPGVKSSPPQREIDRYEQELKRHISQMAVKQFSEVSGTDGIHVRDILPEEDFQSGADNAWDGNTRYWAQNGLDAGARNEVYEIDSDDRADRKLIGIFALSHVQNATISSEVGFDDGTGTRFERVNVQEVLNRDDDPVALLKQPIIFNATQEGSIYQWATEAGDDQIVYHGAVAEKAGRTLGERAGKGKVRV